MKMMKNILLLTMLSFTATFLSCKEDIVSDTVITGKVFHSDTKEGYEGISIAYETILIDGSLLGGSSLPTLLGYTDSLGNYEVSLTIDEDKSYNLVYRDTAYFPGRVCRYFVGEIDKNVDRTEKSQRIDVPVKYLSRCESFD